MAVCLLRATFQTLDPPDLVGRGTRRSPPIPHPTVGALTNSVEPRSFTLGKSPGDIGEERKVITRGALLGRPAVSYSLIRPLLSLAGARHAGVRHTAKLVKLYGNPPGRIGRGKCLFLQSVQPPAICKC